MPYMIHAWIVWATVAKSHETNPHESSCTATSQYPTPQRRLNCVDLTIVAQVASMSSRAEGKERNSQKSKDLRVDSWGATGFNGVQQGSVAEWQLLTWSTAAAARGRSLRTGRKG